MSLDVPSVERPIGGYQRHPLKSRKDPPVAPVMQVTLGEAAAWRRATFETEMAVPATAGDANSGFVSPPVKAWFRRG